MRRGKFKLIFTRSGTCNRAHFQSPPRDALYLILVTTMASNPSDAADELIELTSDSDEEDTYSEEDESDIDFDICVRGIIL